MMGTVGLPSSLGPLCPTIKTQKTVYSLFTRIQTNRMIHTRTRRMYRHMMALCNQLGAWAESENGLDRAGTGAEAGQVTYTCSTPPLRPLVLTNTINSSVTLPDTISSCDHRQHCHQHAPCPACPIFVPNTVTIVPRSPSSSPTVTNVTSCHQQPPTSIPIVTGIFPINHPHRFCLSDSFPIHSIVTYSPSPSPKSSPTLPPAQSPPPTKLPPPLSHTSLDATTPHTTDPDFHMLSAVPAMPSHGPVLRLWDMGWWVAAHPVSWVMNDCPLAGPGF